MLYEPSDRAKKLQKELLEFMDEYIYPNEKTYNDQMDAFRKAGSSTTYSIKR